MTSYQFDHFKDFFEYHLKKNTLDHNGKKKSTLNDLATRLGYSSASILSMVSKGVRLPTEPLLAALFDEWHIPASERQRVRLQVEIEKRSRKGGNTFQLVSKLTQISPYHKINLKQFSLIREWYILVVKILASCPDFSEDPVAISTKLRRKVTPAQAKKALVLLQDLGLLVRDPASGKLSAPTSYTETTNGVPSEAIRENHKGMLKRALEAIDEQSVHQRILGGVTFQFDAIRIDEASSEIFEFVKTFNQKYNSESSNQVYQLAVQFFEHSNGGTKNDH